MFAIFLSLTYSFLKKENVIKYKQHLDNKFIVPLDEIILYYIVQADIISWDEQVSSYVES